MVFHEAAKFEVAMARSVNPSGSSARPHLLPPDLPKALTWLSVEELDTLANAIQTEQKRRAASTGNAGVFRIAGKPSRPNPVGPRIGQINAIRAAIKAGVTPTTIAKQFGVTKATVAEIASSRPHQS